MRRLALVLLAAGLAACQSAPAPVVDDLNVMVGGPLGHPVITSVEGTASDQEVTEEPGRGNVISMNTPILYSISSFDEDGELLRGGSISLGTLTQDIPYHTLINGKQEGTRITVANPQNTRMEIVVIDLLYTQAWGEPVDLSGGPTVTEGDDGGPILAEPADVKSLSTQILRRGDGAQVSTDDTVILQYSVYNAENAKLLDSSWTTGPVQVPLAELGQGLQTALDGSTLGSRIMALLPASDGYGSYDAIVFVDLLAVPTLSD